MLLTITDTQTQTNTGKDIASPLADITIHDNMEQKIANPIFK